MMTQSWSHVRLAVRLLARTPAFTLTAAISIAIGIGANTTIFTIANAMLLAPTPGVAAPNRLVDIGAARKGEGFDTLSYPTYADIRDHTTTLSGVYAVRIAPEPMSLGEADGAVRIYGQLVSASFFDVLGVNATRGAFFHAADEQLGVPLRKVVIAHTFWQRQFAGDPAIIGRDILINGDHYVVAGVAPDRFHGTTILSPDVWVPLTAYGKAMPSDELIRGRRNLWLIMGGRLKPGVTIGQARAELASLHAGMAREFPDAYRDMALVAAPISRVPGEFGDVIVPVVAMLAAVVGLVLLIACTNLAGLLLARGAARSREMAVRAALGATRGDLASQLLIESLLLFVIGGATGLLLAKSTTSALWSLMPPLPVPLEVPLVIDWRVALFAAGLSLITALVTGLVPAWTESRADLVSSIKADASAPARQRLRHVFVAAQMGLCLLLIVVAGLFLRALGAVSHVDPGFRVAGIDIARVDLSLNGYPRDASPVVTEQLRQRLAAIPGVLTVAVAAVVPLGGDGLGLGELRKPSAIARREADIDADWNVISPEFLPMLGVPIVHGRNFSAADGRDGPLVAIINERFAKTVWPGEDPIGKTIETGDFGKASEIKTMTVVGVARDAKYRWIGDRPRQFIHVPIAQQSWQRLNIFLARDARAGSVNLAPAIRATLKQFDANLPLVSLTSFDDVASLGLLPQRLGGSVAGSLGVVALLLAAIGIYGVTAYSVARRTREIGIRMALGAGHGTVMRMILLQGLRLTLIGGGAGLCLAVFAAMGLASQNVLFGIPTIDPVSFGGATATLIAIALAASYVPARRAARVEPLIALRSE